MDYYYYLLPIFVGISTLTVLPSLFFFSHFPCRGRNIPVARTAVEGKTRLTAEPRYSVIPLQYYVALYTVVATIDVDNFRHTKKLTLT